MEATLIYPSAIVRGSFPEFLDAAKSTLDEYLKDVETNIWNVCQSGSMFDDRLSDLINLIAKKSFEVLEDQGFSMDDMQTVVTEFWGQEIQKHGQHAEHVHANGSQLTGFYFVDVPENSTHPYVFDPRPGKRQINLPVKNEQEVSFAASDIGIEVNPGDLVLINSWLPHGFGRNMAEEPFRFIHFNVSVEKAAHQDNVEIV